MTDILRSSLERLQAILGTTFNGRGVEASNVVQDVVAFCLDTVTESEIGEEQHLTQVPDPRTSKTSSRQRMRLITFIIQQGTLSR